MAHGHLAPRREGASVGTLRRGACAGRRWATQRIRDMGYQHMPGDEAGLIGERRASGERKYYVSNLPADTPIKTLASTIKARWICEQAHQHLKEELGLDHFEGRSWQGGFTGTPDDNNRLHLPPTSPPRNRDAGEKRVTGPPPQPSLPAVRHTIIAHMIFAWRRRCPHCRKWLSSA
jgi:hypothetical protein